MDIRIISATNRNMMELVRAGRFREDLYYRLNVFPITIPPLRARREDIPDLVRLFITRCAAEEGKRIEGIDPAALALLQRYDWPGNVRQLENAVFRAIVLTDGPVLTVGEFPQIAMQLAPLHGDGGAGEQDAAAPLAERLPAPVAAAAAAPAEAGAVVPAAPAGPAGAVPAVGADGEMRTLEEIEADVIRLALERYNGRMSEIARRLKIGRSTLYRKLHDLGLAESA